MNPFTDAILPLLLIALSGLGLRRIGFFTPERRQALEVTAYYVLVPALIVSRLARADFGADLLGPLALAVLVPVFSIPPLLLALRSALRRPPFWLQGPALPCTLQGIIRNNVFITLAIGQAVMGDRGALLMALAAMFNMPAANLLSVGALVHSGHGGRGTFTRALRALATNPLLLATAAGLFLGLSELPLPEPLLRGADMLAAGVLPLIMLAVGAGLTWPALRGGLTPLIFASSFKLLVMPAMGFLVARMLDAGPELTFAVVLFHAAPAAAGAYLLARQLGGDAELMAAMVSVQTALAALTMPLVLALTGGLLV